MQLSSWGWAYSCSKHVEDSNKRIIEETVSQVGHLPELYEDARSEKYQKNVIRLLIFNSNTSE
jgi:hypothetical protein